MKYQQLAVGHSIFGHFSSCQIIQEQYLANCYTFKYMLYSDKWNYSSNFSFSFILHNSMDSHYRQENETDSQIRKLLKGIQNTTIQMSNTFEQAILRHEQQFIKTYRTKISQLSKLFQDLTKVIQDKFVNNALTSRLDIVMKERDYFKYECLKLNMQYQTLQTEQNGLNGQYTNVIEQMNIYKHLLEDQKLKNNNLEANIDKIRVNFTNIAYKSLAETTESFKGASNKIRQHQGSSENLQKLKKKLQVTTQQLKQKSQNNRNLKLKLSEFQTHAMNNNTKALQHHQLYDTFKACVGAWKRNILTKDRKKLHNVDTNKQSNRWFQNNSSSAWDIEKVSSSNKKQLLKYLFTTAQFLDLIEKILFTADVEVNYIHKKQSEEHDYIQENRKKLYQFMKRKKIINSPVFTHAH